MIKRTLAAVVMVSAIGAGVIVGANGPEPVPAALSAMADTEREFARTARTKGIRDSFLDFFAEDSIAFEPAPVSARARLLKQPSAPFAEQELVWEPRYGDVAASGELGWLTGPSTFIDQTSPDKTPHYGNYLSVWRKQSDGRWRVFIDVGTALKEPALFAPGFVRAPFGARYTGKDDKEAATRSLAAADGELNAAIASDGAPSAYRSRVTDGSRLHRAGSAPLTGRTEIHTWLTAQTGAVDATTGAGEAAASGDFGYTYGTYTVRKEPEESGAYVRVWTRDASGAWFVMADVTQRTPPRRPQ